MTFTDFKIHGGTLDAIVAMGYEEPTPIQAQAIPPMLEGRDVVGMARTGTGKTAAFGIPLIDAHRNDSEGIPGLVLLPTRELAIQVTEVLQDLAKASNLAIVPVYGGAGFGQQLDALARRGPKIIVACPGRLLDLVDRGVMDLGNVKTWVLDEADRMLDMGFVRDMRKIERMLPQKRRTALFSATFPDDVQKLVREFTNDPVRISVHDGEATVPEIEQFHARVEKSDKTKALLHLFHDEKPERAIVFTRTKHLAKRLSKRLVTMGWSSVALQGNMTQGQRERAMKEFRAGKARVLVATDVAARGLDVQGVTHVVNFDLPDADSYVHRVGRTARNGAEGKAFTFVQSDEAKDFRDIKKHIGRDVQHIEVRTSDDCPDGPDPKITPETPPNQKGASQGHTRKIHSNNRHGSTGAPRHGSGQGPRAAGARPGGPSRGGRSRKPSGNRQGGRQ